MPKKTRIRCGLGLHPIKGSPTFLTDERLINFVKKIRPEFRSEYEICRTCHKIAERVYKQKYESALRKRKLKLKGSPNHGLVSDPSISSRSNASGQALRNEHDSIDRLVNQTPRLTRQQRQADNQTAATNISNETVSERSAVSSKATSTSTSTSASTVKLASQSQVQLSQSDVVQQISTQNKLLQKQQQQPQSSQSSLDTQPTTSADAARKRLAKQNVQLVAATPQVTADPPIDDDLWSDEASPAVINGARLPHIQPIPRRQTFVHVNKDIMDIYLAGTTGG